MSAVIYELMRTSRRFRQDEFYRNALSWRQLFFRFFGISVSGFLLSGFPVPTIALMSCFRPIAVSRVEISSGYAPNRSQ